MTYQLSPTDKHFLKEYRIKSLQKLIHFEQGIYYQSQASNYKTYYFELLGKAKDLQARIFKE
jgi:hypothetical protein